MEIMAARGGRLIATTDHRPDRPTHSDATNARNTSQQGRGFWPCFSLGRPGAGDDTALDNVLGRKQDQAVLNC